MKPELQILYALGVVSLSATLARVGSDGRMRFLDWLAAGSVVAMFIQITTMIALGKF